MYLEINLYTIITNVIIDDLQEGTAKFAYIESPRVEKRKPGSMQNLLVRRISSDKIGLARRDSVSVSSKKWVDLHVQTTHIFLTYKQYRP